MKRLPHFTLPRCAALLMALAGASSCALPEGAFEHADADGDGKLEVAELDDALAEAVHAAGDRNGDGILTFEEWKAVFPKADQAKFNKYDTEGKGLTLAEATDAMEKEGTFDKLLSKIDTNGDGVVDKAEAGVFYDALQAAEGDNDVQKLDNILNS